MIEVRHNFVWLVIPAYKAETLYSLEYFDLFILHDDGSESMIESFDEIRTAEELGLPIALEVDHMSKIIEKFTWKKQYTKKQKNGKRID